MKRFFQLSNKDLLKIIVKPLIYNNQLISILVLFLRIVSLGYYGRLKGSSEDLKFNISDSNEKFVLDIRCARLNLHLLAILAQFFVSIKEKYKSFEVWIDENTYTFNLSRLYDGEYKNLINLFSDTLKINFIKKNQTERLNKNNSFLSISYINGMFWKGNDWNLSEEINEIFCKKFNLESRPINFSNKINYLKYKQIYSLESIMKKNFNIAFLPTLDLNCISEKPERKLGVISESTFKNMQETYVHLIDEIRRRKICNIKIYLLNKKAYDWPINEFVYDFRNFENYGLNFASMIGFLHKNFHWTFGSEGTLLNYLMLSDKLKHAIYIDNSHWPKINSADGCTVPMFYKNYNYIDYKDKPKTFVPEKENVIKAIFDDYNSVNF